MARGINGKGTLVKLQINGWIGPFDRAVTAWVQGWGEGWRPFMLFVTHAGQPQYAVAVSLLALIYCVYARRVSVGLAFVGVMSGLWVVSILKAVIARPRPETVYVTTYKPNGLSFPSGHAAGTMLIYGLVAYLALKYLPQPWGWITAALLAVFIFFVGVSRIYVGAHFPTDVIGGWILGVVWLAIVILLTRP